MAHVLIVDDCRDLVELCTELLETAGHRVTTRQNGAEGLKSLDVGPLPDSILLDVDMPVLSGPGMAAGMRERDGRDGEELIPILLVSARHDLSAIAGRVGTPYFLPKSTPDYGRTLLKLLDRALFERHHPAVSRRPTVTMRWATRIGDLLTKRPG